ncbi:MAG: L,D-transpeptidase [Candidatus Wukongarchaeota archaeon]|nr:L,D-transpeptidase [Candidatus Wukongarchaeota archaeon]MDO8128470.1 L,D-transpeptidase [Candidatus Wukongarchaeota archaeon]
MGVLLFIRKTGKMRLIDDKGIVRGEWEARNNTVEGREPVPLGVHKINTRPGDVVYYDEQNSKYESQGPLFIAIGDYEKMDEDAKRRSGIHGHGRKPSIEHLTKGCIRMWNEEVLEMFEKIQELRKEEENVEEFVIILEEEGK